MKYVIKLLLKFLKSVPLVKILQSGSNEILYEIMIKSVTSNALWDRPHGLHPSLCSQKYIGGGKGGFSSDGCNNCCVEQMNK